MPAILVGIRPFCGPTVRRPKTYSQTFISFCPDKLAVTDKWHYFLAIKGVQVTAG
jgi:hypothetical protein